MTSKQPSSGHLYWKLPVDIAARPDISGNAKIVWAAIADRVGGHDQAWLGMRRLAKDCGISRAHAERMIRELAAAGLLIVERQKCGRRTNRYSVPQLMPVEAPLRPAGGTQESSETGLCVPPAGQMRPAGGTKPEITEPSPDRTQTKTRRKTDAPPDTLTRDAVALWCDTYREARGVKPDPMTGRTVGMLRRLIHKEAAGNLELFRERLRLAAGVGERAPPWPFGQPGALTIPALVRHWDALGDTLRARTNDDSTTTTKQNDLPGRSGIRCGDGGRRGPSRAIPTIKENIVIRPYPGTE